VKSRQLFLKIGSGHVEMHHGAERGNSLGGIEMSSWRFMSTVRLQELFAQALERTAAERETFILRECGLDNALLRDLRSLIAADEAAQGESIWQRRPGSFRDLDETDAGERCGERIGPYRIVELIGVGGMGAVYRGVREDSEYNQSVAIKFVKRGMDTDSIVRRFRQERQILANLEHRSIARLLDGGSTPDGLPYLVMEYIEGRSLNEFCQSATLSIKAKLTLFGEICSAVQYAHQHLVIHRDLKPSNIMVTADGMPKLLDFGIARILVPESQHANTETNNINERALTPGYASPEQINGESITTASDVYSLGVILYEILTGRSPYGEGSRTPAELMRAVCAEQPEKPSSKCRALKGDLDNIVLMALRKEPGRRYASVEQLSDDVHRYLALRPVHARGAGLTYGASRFVRRHWVATGTVALIVTALVCAIVVTTRAEARAEHRFNDVRQLAHSFVFDYYDAIEPLPGATPVRQRLVKEALHYLDSLAGEADSVSLQRELVEAYVKISRVQGNTYESNLGDVAGALASVNRAISIGTVLVKRDSSAETLGALGGAYLDLAELMHGNNQLEAAEQTYRKALGFLERAANMKPADINIALQLMRTERHLGDLNGAEGTANLGRSAEAGKLYQQAARDGEKILKEHPGLLAVRRALYKTYVTMAGLASTTGHAEQGMEGYEKALATIHAISAANPNDANDRMEIAGTSIRLAREYMAASEPDKALEYFKEAEGIVSSLCKADPQNELYRRDLSVTQVHIGNALLKKGSARASISYFNTAAAMSVQLLAPHPGSVEFLGDLALAERKLGQAFAATNDNGGARRHARKSLAILEKLARNSPDVSLIASLARSEQAAGEIELRSKAVAAAMTYFTEARINFAKLTQADPSNVGVRRELESVEKAMADDPSTLKK
jgi:non-specific serine/threonine protein kinase/serine/threonine-protein kinase